MWYPSAVPFVTEVTCDLWLFCTQISLLSPTVSLLAGSRLHWGSSQKPADRSSIATDQSTREDVYLHPSQTRLQWMWVLFCICLNRQLQSILKTDQFMDDLIFQSFHHICRLQTLWSLVERAKLQMCCFCAVLLWNCKKHQRSSTLLLPLVMILLLQHLLLHPAPPPFLLPLPLLFRMC